MKNLLVPDGKYYTYQDICQVLELYKRKYFAARVSYFHVWWCLKYAHFCGMTLPGGLYKSRRTSINQVYFILQEGIPLRRYSKNEIQLLLTFPHPLDIYTPSLIFHRDWRWKYMWTIFWGIWFPWGIEYREWNKVYIITLWEVLSLGSHSLVGCVVEYFDSYNINKIQQDETGCRYLFTAKSLYMFRVSIAPIIRGT